jgi:hypothetical protein
MSEQPIISVDFDGTIVEHDFPRIGKPLPEAFEVLRELKEAGFKLILWTCREDHNRLIAQRYLTHAVEFCRDGNHMHIFTLTIGTSAAFLGGMSCGKNFCRVEKQERVSEH